MEKMSAEQRRSQILACLCTAKEAVNAASLAARFSVSRQIIVGDIAVLRAAGSNILATPRGYLLRTGKENDGLIRLVACLHESCRMEEELDICVDHGCTVIDVMVEHPVYGQLQGLLEVSNRYEVDRFMKRVQEHSAHALSELTDGIHLHTLKCPDEETFARTKDALKTAGFLYSGQ